MTPTQLKLRALRQRQSRERGRMSELGLAENLTDETRAELDTIERGTPDLERQIRAATVTVEAEEAEQRAAGAAARAPEDDAEAREVRELRGKVKLSGYVAAAVEQRSAEGAEAEYNAARGIAGNRFPLELLAPEMRATTDADTTTMPRRWLDRLFAGTAAERIGITMESVPTGVASYPVTTAGASAAQRQRSTDSAADAAWTIGVTEIRPTRNAVRLLFSIEDAARIPGLESALTRDLRMALMEGVDRAIFLGDATASGTDADITGLTTAAITETTITQSNKILGAGNARRLHRDGRRDSRKLARRSAGGRQCRRMASLGKHHHQLDGGQHDPRRFPSSCRTVVVGAWRYRRCNAQWRLRGLHRAFHGHRGRRRSGCLGSRRVDPRSLQRGRERRGRTDALLSLGLRSAASVELHAHQVCDLIMSGVERREAGGEIRVEGRRLSGVVMKYGDISPSHRERFLPGSLRLAGCGSPRPFPRHRKGRCVASGRRPGAPKWPQCAHHACGSAAYPCG